MLIVKLSFLVLLFLNTLVAESFRQWMKSHDIREGLHDYYGDFDSDGIPNGLEYFLGTNPLRKSKQCLRPKIKNGKLHVEHNISNTFEDVEVEYLWSKDLVTYHLSGEAASDGTVAIITQTSSSDNTRIVSADLIEGDASSIYIKMVVKNTATLNWGSDPELGGALFSNASTISLVDKDLNPLSDVLSVGYDPYGIWGYAHLEDQIMDVSFTGIPMILIDALDGSQGLVSASSWKELLFASASSTPPLNNYKIGINDTADDIIDWGEYYDLNSVRISNASGVGNLGVSIYVVPEITIDPEIDPEIDPSADFPVPEPPFWASPSTDVCPKCLFAPFGGTVAINDVYVFQTDYFGGQPAETWGGFLYKDANAEYPLTFGTGGEIIITARVYPSANLQDTDFYLLLGKNDFPDMIPYYITEQITISGTGATIINVNIPEQGLKEFNSVALYIVQQDSPIVIEDVQFNTSPPVDPVGPVDPVDPVDPVEPGFGQIIYLIESLKDSIGRSNDFLNNLYDMHPNLEIELRIVEREISKSDKLINKIAESDIDFSNFFLRKKILRILRKIKVNVNDAIDHLSFVSDHGASYNNKFYDEYSVSWKSLKKYFMLQKFLKNSDYIEYYNFEEILNTFKAILEDIRELKIKLKFLNLRPKITDYVESEYCLKNEEVLAIIDDYQNLNKFDVTKFDPMYPYSVDGNQGPYNYGFIDLNKDIESLSKHKNRGKDLEGLESGD